MISAHLVFANADNLLGVKIWFTFAPSNTKSMEQSNLNLSTDFVKDMLAESPAKEPNKAVADRISKQPKKCALGGC